MGVEGKRGISRKKREEKKISDLRSCWCRSTDQRKLTLKRKRKIREFKRMDRKQVLLVDALRTSQGHPERKHKTIFTSSKC